MKAVNAYTDALTLLDNYDHQTLSKPEGADPVYRITYEECRNMIDHMEYAGKSLYSEWREKKVKYPGFWMPFIRTYSARKCILLWKRKLRICSTS